MLGASAHAGITVMQNIAASVDLLAHSVLDECKQRYYMTDVNALPETITAERSDTLMGRDVRVTVTRSPKNDSYTTTFYLAGKRISRAHIPVTIVENL